MNDPEILLAPLRRLHDEIRDTVVAATASQHIEQMARVHRDQEGDTIYAIDAIGE
jgi:hypothetical protein